MDEAAGTRYWCHMCSQVVSPVVEVDVKCPTCQSGFIEEVEASNDRDVNRGFNDDAAASDPAMSLWVPLMLGMMSGVRPGRRVVRVQLVPRDGSQEERVGEDQRDGENEMNDRRRRRSAAAILDMLQGIRNHMAAESDNSNDGNREREREGQRREHVILINPFNHTIIVQGSYNSEGDGEAPPPLGSIGDYFFGPSLDMLLQHLAENDPNRYGTPPAKKEAIESMPIVKIQDNMQCSVCLDDFEIGAEAREMPCKHKFHDSCIMPWLQLHSSCPVCRYQLPADESKIGSSRRESNNANGDSNPTTVGDENRGGGVGFSIPWPFNALFSFRGNTASGSSDNSGNGGGDSQAGES
ncbi:unnamed protein product [Rhodiola kirilowii]